MFEQLLLQYQGLVDWRDLLDIAIVAVLLCRIIQLLRNSRTLAIVLGIFLVTGLYIISRLFELYTIGWILQNVFSSLFLVIVIIFQPDIRNWLGDIGTTRIMQRNTLNEDFIEEIVSACEDMAQNHIGALIVIERKTPLNDLIKQEGHPVDAKVSQKLIKNIFYPKAPLHDGAIIISKGRIAAAACILPLAVAKNENFGTRHRAGLGISECSDAATIVVSEERGEISLALHGKLTRKMDPNKLRKDLRTLLSSK